MDVLASEIAYLELLTVFRLQRIPFFTCQKLNSPGKTNATRKSDLLFLSYRFGVTSQHDRKAHALNKMSQNDSQLLLL